MWGARSDRKLQNNFCFEKTIFFFAPEQFLFRKKLLLPSITTNRPGCDQLTIYSTLGFTSNNKKFSFCFTFKFFFVLQYFPPRELDITHPLLQTWKRNCVVVISKQSHYRQSYLMMDLSLYLKLVLNRLSLSIRLKISWLKHYLKSIKWRRRETWTFWSQISELLLVISFNCSC